jgi:hypothetical protein
MSSSYPQVPRQEPLLHVANCVFLFCVPTQLDPPSKLWKPLVILCQSVTRAFPPGSRFVLIFDVSALLPLCLWPPSSLHREHLIVWFVTVLEGEVRLISLCLTQWALRLQQLLGRQVRVVQCLALITPGYCPECSGGGTLGFLSSAPTPCTPGSFIPQGLYPLETPLLSGLLSHLLDLISRTLCRDPAPLWSSEDEDYNFLLVSVAFLLLPGSMTSSSPLKCSP